MQQPIRIDIDLSEEYFAEGWLEATGRSRILRGAILLLVFSGTVGLGYMVYGLVEMEVRNARVQLVLAFIASVAVTVFLGHAAESLRLIQGGKKSLAMMLARVAASQYREQGLFVAKWTFDESGITKSLNNEVLSWEWERVKRVIRRPGGLVLYTPPAGQFAWIPLSAVREDERSDFLKLVERKVPDFVALPPRESDADGSFSLT